MSGKNPVLSDAGRRGARRRWGEQRVLRLDDLEAPYRRAVLALIAAAEAAKAETPGSGQ